MAAHVRALPLLKSPDTCRFWDKATGKKLDKDRFRRDLGDVEEAYREIIRRLMGE